MSNLSPAAQLRAGADLAPRSLPLEDAAAVIHAVGETIKHFGRPVTWAERKHNRERELTAAVEAVNAELRPHRYRIERNWRGERPYALRDCGAFRYVAHYGSLDAAVAKARALVAAKTEA
jgi:hypothetical protein